MNLYWCQPLLSECFPGCCESHSCVEQSNYRRISMSVMKKYPGWLEYHLCLYKSHIPFRVPTLLQGGYVSYPLRSLQLTGSQLCNWLVVHNPSRRPCPPSPANPHPHLRRRIPHHRSLCHQELRRILHTLIPRWCSHRDASSPHSPRRRPRPTCTPRLRHVHRPRRPPSRHPPRSRPLRHHRRIRLLARGLLPCHRSAVFRDGRVLLGRPRLSGQEPTPNVP